MALEKYEQKYGIIISKYRLYQGLALLDSLERAHTDSGVFVLCLDNETYSIVSMIKSDFIVPIPIDFLEDDQLKSIRADRLLCEYCWTLKPIFLEYLFHNYSNMKRLTYLDADLFFFSEPYSIFLNRERPSVLLSKHNYSKQYKRLERYCGKYNSGLISFLNDQTALKCLEWWKKQCINLCSISNIDDQFGDQKYLDQMPLRFSGVASIENAGVNIAPWNDESCKLSARQSSVYFGNHKLVCYHFSGFRLHNQEEFSLSFGYQRKPIPVIYSMYLAALKKAIDQVAAIDPDFSGYSSDAKMNGSSILYKIQDYLIFQ